MNDFHVEALHYQLVHPEHVDYDNAPPQEHNGEVFSVLIKAGKATVTMLEHFSTEGEARAIVDPFLRNWELIGGLEGDPGDIQFKFEKAIVIDRNLKPGQVQGFVMAAEANDTCHATGTANISSGRYPTPSINFELSTDVYEMYSLLKEHRSGTRLSVVAYHCLTVLERRAGNRSRIHLVFNICRTVTNKLGHLTSDKRGAPHERRKAPGGAPYTGLERQWLHETARAFIRRAGEYAHSPDGPFKKITMADLPKLD